MNSTLQSLALDLTKNAPRSPRETLGGYVIAARTLDKCRAVLAGTQGEYHFGCPLDAQFLDFAEIKVDDFKDFVAGGATDEQVAAWIQANSKVTDPNELVAWNNKLRGTRLCDMPIELQVFLEEYIPKYLPKGRPVYVWFDVYDLEEGRL